MAESEPAANKPLPEPIPDVLPDRVSTQQAIELYRWCTASSQTGVIAAFISALNSQQTFKIEPGVGKLGKQLYRQQIHRHFRRATHLSSKVTVHPSVLAAPFWQTCADATKSMRVAVRTLARQGGNRPSAILDGLSRGTVAKHHDAADLKCKLQFYMIYGQIHPVPVIAGAPVAPWSPRPTPSKPRHAPRARIDAAPQCTVVRRQERVEAQFRRVVEDLEQYIEKKEAELCRWEADFEALHKKNCEVRVCVSAMLSPVKSFCTRADGAVAQGAGDAYPRAQNRN